MHSIVIRFATNGYVLTANNSDGVEVFSEDFIAHDVNDVCGIVRDLICLELANIDMSHVVTDTVKRA